MKLHNKIEKFLNNKKFTFVHLETVESTMVEIKKYTGNQNTLMIADQQTAGIGRRGDKWISPKGNIHLSLLLKYDLSIEKHFLFSAIMANAIVKLITELVKEKINIKWPNDIIINERKIAGIITEIVEINNIKYIIIGAGINILSSPIISDYKTCCLNDFANNIKYEDIIFNMIKSYFVEYEMILEEKNQKILDKFRNKMIYFGTMINILLPNGDTHNVLLKNLNNDGSLLVEKDGEDKKIFSARIINDSH